MHKHNNNLKASFDSQAEVFKTYLSANTATCSMVADQTDLPQKNLTRFKTELQKKGLLKVVCVAVCRKTGFKAQYLTTNPVIIKCFKL